MSTATHDVQAILSRMHGKLAIIAIEVAASEGDVKEYPAGWLKNATSVVRDASGQFASKAGAAASSVKDAAKRAGTAAKDAAGRAGSAARTTADSVKDAVESKVNEAANSEKAKQVKEGVDKLKAEMGKMESRVKDALASFDPKQLSAMKDQISAAANSDAVKAQFADLKTGLEGNAAALVGKVEKSLQDKKPNDAIAAIKNGWNDLKKKTDEAMTAMGDSVDKVKEVSKQIMESGAIAPALLGALSATVGTICVASSGLDFVAAGLSVGAVPAVGPVALLGTAIWGTLGTHFARVGVKQFNQADKYFAEAKDKLSKIDAFSQKAQSQAKASAKQSTVN